MFYRRASGLTELANLLQAQVSPMSGQNNIGELLQRPSTSRAESGASSEPANNDDPLPPARPSTSSRVGQFFQHLSRISNRIRSTEPQAESNDEPNSERNEDQEDASSPDEESDDRDYGFLVIPSDPTTGSRPRFFSFVTQRSSQRRGANFRGGASGSSSSPSGRIHHNTKRLTHYIKESYSNQVVKKFPTHPFVQSEYEITFILQGRGFIKEVCFSSDGLLLASPYDNGVRILSFNQNLEDLSFCHTPNLEDPPKQLHVVGTITEGHKDVVLSTAFSPNHYLLVTGCHGGAISWHQPTI